MQLSDFDYVLPKELIAQHPVSPRCNSRLLVAGKKVEHKHFFDIVDYFRKGDVLVINETKVIPAKLTGRKETGAKIELIVEHCFGKECTCHIKGTKPRVGNKLIFKKFHAEIIKNENDIFTVVFDADIDTVIKQVGKLPTPPYVKENLRRNSDYQTAYSRKNGSVAAPTAGFHFTKELLEKIQKKGVKIAKVCLHVGFGTFLPVRDLNTHVMHSEYFEVDQKNADIVNDKKRRLFVVGTTSVRVLESAANEQGKIMAEKGETSLFIKPGYKFKTSIDALITNFHLPKSTLLMLVSAFIGREKILKLYKRAIKKKYRFYSFGDAMLLFSE
jgi:S-adenosylmethionine:tRNA ribosyltransferase-isomerase